MTYIPIGTKLRVTEFIPLPVPRPTASIDARIALERATEVTDAFSEGGWYTPTSQVSKSMYELLIESSGKLGLLAVLGVIWYTVYRFRKWKRTGM